MFPGISDFLKDTFTDNIKGLLKPANWLTAAILLILNLLFIFPALIDKNVIPLSVLTELNTSLQFSIAIVLVLVIAYLFSTLKKSTYKLMTGDFWLGSPFLGPLFQKAKQEVKEGANNANKVKAQGGDVLAALNEAPISKEAAMTSQHLPSAENLAVGTRKTDVDLHEYRGYTRLSEELKKIDIEIWEKHRINYKYLWPYMQNVLAEKQELGRIGSEEDMLDFFINLSFVLALFAVEQALVQFFWQQGLAVLWVWVFLALAYSVYRAATSKANSLGDMVAYAFTMHRDKLREQLGLRQFRDSDDERRVWQQVSRWLEAHLTVPHNILPNQLLPPAVSGNADVILKYGVTDVWQQKEKPGEDDLLKPGFEKIYQYVNYVMLVSSRKTEQAKPDGNKPDSDKPGETQSDNVIYIIVTDPQVPIIESTSDGKASMLTVVHSSEDKNSSEETVITASTGDLWLASKVIPSTRSTLIDQLLWRIKDLKPDSPIVLKYSLPSLMLKVSTEQPGIDIKVEDTEDEDTGTITYKLTIMNTSHDSKDKIKVKILDSRRPLPTSCPIVTGTKTTITTREETTTQITEITDPASPIQPGMTEVKNTEVKKTELEMVETESTTTTIVEQTQLRITETKRTKITTTSEIGVTDIDFCLEKRSNLQPGRWDRYALSVQLDKGESLVLKYTV